MTQLMLGTKLVPILKHEVEVSSALYTGYFIFGPWIHPYQITLLFYIKTQTSVINLHESLPNGLLLICINVKNTLEKLSTQSTQT